MAKSVPVIAMLNIEQEMTNKLDANDTPEAA